MRSSAQRYRMPVEPTQSWGISTVLKGQIVYLTADVQAPWSEDRSAAMSFVSTYDATCMASGLSYRTKGLEMKVIDLNAG